MLLSASSVIDFFMDLLPVFFLLDCGSPPILEREANHITNPMNAKREMRSLRQFRHHLLVVPWPHSRYFCFLRAYSSAQEPGAGGGCGAHEATSKPTTIKPKLMAACRREIEGKTGAFM
jgi:hypothetical protein